MAYFANGTEGMILDEQCCNCFYIMDTDKEPKSCPVHFVHLTYNSDQLKKGNEQLRAALNLLVNQNGECQVKKLVDEMRLYKPEDKNQLKMFG